MSINKRILFALSIILSLPGPYLVGIIPEEFSNIYLLFGIILIGFILFKKNLKKLTINVSLLVISCCLILTLFDLISRPLLQDTLYYRPSDMFCNKFPLFHQVPRYAKNSFYKGKASGDLAHMLENKDYRQLRNVVFQTDSLGFRNTPGASNKVVDLILLGDSYGVGVGTTQDKTWGTLLAKNYNLKTYNLSVPSSPWGQLITFRLEANKLKTHKNSLVLWAIFTGNDLGGLYGEEIKHIKHNNRLERFSVAHSTFKNRSPFRLLQKKQQYREYHDQVKQQILAKEFGSNKKALFYLPYVGQANLSSSEILRHPNYEKLKSIFEEMEKLANSSSLNIAVVLLPTKSEVYSWILYDQAPWSLPTPPSDFSQTIKELSQAAGFSFLDLKPFMVKAAQETYAASGKLLWWNDDTHWNELGHKVAAETVYDNLLGPLAHTKY